MDIKGKQVLVFGTGISGIAAGQLLLSQGADVILYDGNASLDAAMLKEELKEGAQEPCAAQGPSSEDAAGEAPSGAKAGDAEVSRRVRVILGEFPEEELDALDLVVISPGVPTDLPIVHKMREMQIPIWGEVELAYVFGRGDVLAITGTNGKTTTTTLLGEIMKNYRDSVYVVGNIGNPYACVASETREDSVVVAEMSSFQLETIHTFRPKVSAVLNITPDHLNRHHTMEAYIEAKKNIFQNQTEKDTCVLNYEDEVTRKFGENTKAEVLYFSSRRKLERGVYLEGSWIMCCMNRPEQICRTDELQLLGVHNFENVMAAAAMAAAYGVPMEIIRRSVKEFRGVEHRIEFVAEIRGVAYYNDSKATNPDAAIRGIQAMNRPTLLIGGGYDKNSTYEEWIQAFGGKVKKLVLLGATAEKIAAEAHKLGFEDTILVETFEEAVKTCMRYAVPGDAVLLSPACASWGMFKNYEERGEKFKELVKQF